MTVTVETGLWQLDPTASTVAVRHKTFWGLVAVKGTFAGVTGRGEVTADGTATGTVTIGAASLDTGNKKRDEHLRSADFFDAGNHPEITFAVRSARHTGDEVQVDGQLTVRGVSRPQKATAKLVSADADGLTLEAEFQVVREEFGITFNQMRMMGGPTTVTATLRFTRTAA
ncbi:YceI family protein [Streptomyces sp. Ag109_O5-10]|uniref:YceI family protein n=1 Tax=Streptomyces sp. Ag109_O5-10 TaxID=1855349 RepID=UPI0008993861|nr:YceI family protein [Streptomyces sp. Ag109_O5-10]SEE39020.1 Polyisoprenoid-binding protein YceI [Streptomyces sp. Ag109_O5-10]